MNNNDELYHYGVQGMKWGRHKYAEQGGSYVRKGLKIFDQKMQNYESADKKVKSLKGGDKNAYRQAKGERKLAKKELDRSYKQLESDARADKGAELYRSGKTISGNLTKNFIAQGVITVGGRLAQKAILSSTGNEKVARIAANTIGIDGTAVNAIMAGKTISDNRKLRAYYGHTRTVR